MFNPSREEVRQFFVSAWAKARAGQPLEALELMASDWIREHPEYHSVLEHPEACSLDFPVEQGQSNPFLHLSMHLSLSEQMSIDQPPGVRAALEALASRRGGLHEAMHLAMEALGEMLWESQRNGAAPDAMRYVEQLQRWARDGR
ncbi:Protein of unknown function DUF1841 [Burkholderiales bacterium]